MIRMITIVGVTFLLGLFLASLAMAAEQSGIGDSVAAVDNRETLASYLNGTTVSPLRQNLQACFKQLGEQVSAFKLPQQPENPELIAMVICSKHLSTEEKQYWLDMLPQMTAEQRQQLQDTLIAEFQKNINPLQQELNAISQQLPPAGESKQ